jgi:oxygen-independent coproporphyrinogen-3 oxidase
MIQAIQSEIQLRKNEITQPLETIYFGGGTPSLLTPDQLRSILQDLFTAFRVKDDAEITLEANPEDLTLEKARALASLGVNRLSVGIQTFDDGQLQFLNRAHDSGQAMQSIKNARTAGIDNLTLDLIFALPGHGIEKFERDVRQALDLGVPHMSVYGLTIEEGTAFGNWVRKGKLKEETESQNLAQYQLAEKILESAGYEHYEVSNYALPGHRSRHNTAYWLQKPYLGLGPGAHSYDGECRLINLPNNHLYMKAIETSGTYQEKEELSRIDKINEYLLTRLRTVYGAELGYLKSELQKDLLTEKRKIIQTLIEKGLATVEEDVLKLTKRGFMIADEVSLELFYEK